MSILSKIDILSRQLKDAKQISLLSEIRKEIKRDEKYKEKLYSHLTNTLDGVRPEESARNLKLL